MSEKRVILPNGMFYSGKPAGATRWTQELVDKHGPDATVKEVCEAESKHQGAGKSSKK